MDEERFNVLRAAFGNDGNADELTLNEFRSLSAADATDLIKRIKNYRVKAELEGLRGNTILTFIIYSL